MAESTFTLKLLIDTGKVKRVLFAEANKDFVDFLFHILSLPVAAVIRLLRGEGMQGSLPNLFQSLENLSNDYIQPNKSKDIFLNPAVPVSAGTSPPLLVLSYAAADKKVDKKFYMCRNYHSTSRGNSGGAVYVSNDPSAVCPDCSKTMTEALSYVEPPAVNGAGPSGGGGLVKGVVTYMVLDDLVVKPMSTISSIALLNELGVKELGALEERVVNFGKNEAVKLLKACIGSKSVLTDVFC